MTRSQRDTISYAFVAVLSAFLLLWGIPAFSPEYPGYGVPASLVPNIAAGAMLLLALLGLLRTALARRHEPSAPAQGKTICWLHLARFLVPCFLLMPAMSFFGFVPAGVGFLGLIQFFCGQREPLPLILVAALPVLLVWIIMRYGLGVPMP